MFTLFFFILVYSCCIKSQTEDILYGVGHKIMLKTCPVNKNYMLLITCIRLISRKWKGKAQNHNSILTGFFSYCLKGIATKSWSEVFVSEIVTQKSPVEMRTVLSPWVNSSFWETPSHNSLSELSKTRKNLSKPPFRMLDYFIRKIFPLILQVKYLQITESLYSSS